MNHRIPTIIIALALALTACQEKTAEPAATPPNIQPTQPGINVDVLLPQRPNKKNVGDLNHCPDKKTCEIACPENAILHKSDTDYTCKKDDDFHGPRVIFREDGSQLAYQEWKNGKKNGEWILFYASGEMSSRSKNINGQSTGESTSWFKNGRVKHHCPIAVNGKMTCIQYYEDGTKEHERPVLNGEHHGTWVRWRQDGTKASETELRHSKFHGKKTSYYANGQIRQTAYYIQDKKQGLVTNFHPNGQKKSEAQYKEGQLLSQTCWDEKGQTIDCPKD